MKYLDEEAAMRAEFAKKNTMCKMRASSKKSCNVHFNTSSQMPAIKIMRAPHLHTAKIYSDLNGDLQNYITIIRLLQYPESLLQNTSKSVNSLQFFHLFKVNKHFFFGFGLSLW